MQIHHRGQARGSSDPPRALGPAAPSSRWTSARCRSAWLARRSVRQRTRLSLVAHGQWRRMMMWRAPHLTMYRRRCLKYDARHTTYDVTHDTFSTRHITHDPRHKIHDTRHKRQTHADSRRNTAGGSWHFFGEATVTLVRLALRAVPPPTRTAGRRTPLAAGRSALLVQGCHACPSSQTLGSVLLAWVRITPLPGPPSALQTCGTAPRLEGDRPRILRWYVQLTTTFVPLSGLGPWNSFLRPVVAERVACLMVELRAKLSDPSVIYLAPCIADEATRPGALSIATALRACELHVKTIREQSTRGQVSEEALLPPAFPPPLLLREALPRLRQVYLVPTDPFWEQ